MYKIDRRGGGGTGGVQKSFSRNIPIEIKDKKEKLNSLIIVFVVSEDRIMSVNKRIIYNIYH